MGLKTQKIGQLFDFDPVTNWTIPGDQVTVIWQLESEKKLSKYINMGSSFEDFVATKTTVKTDLNFELRFKR